MLSDTILKLIHHWIYFIMIPSFVKKILIKCSIFLGNSSKDNCKIWIKKGWFVIVYCAES